jgi:hypothetical protein
MDNFDYFMSVYSEELRKAIVGHPDEYAYPVEEADIVVARMAAALQRGSANVNSRAFKTTAKRLGIKPTRKDIYAYLGRTI